jgi:hypothetical protein
VRDLQDKISLLHGFEMLFHEGEILTSLTNCGELFLGRVFEKKKKHILL